MFWDHIEVTIPQYPSSFQQEFVTHTSAPHARLQYKRNKELVLLTLHMQ